MRAIDKVIIHHSVTPKSLKLKKSLNSFNNSHKKRLHPEADGGTDYPCIAYHYVIGGDGIVVNTRLDEVVGYHASNLEINNSSIGICLCGNFDKEQPNKLQYESLQNLIKELKDKYISLDIEPHSDRADKTCPGKNFKMELIDAGKYELLFKVGKCKGKSSVVNNINDYVELLGEFNREQAYFNLIIWERLNNKKAP